MISFDSLGNKGWLGNQMFQYASLRGIAYQNEMEWIIPPNDGTQIHNYLLLETFELENCKDKNIGYLENLVEKKAISEFTEELDRDKKNNYGGLIFYDKIFNNIQENTNLNGFFQSEKYFLDIEDSIRNDFTFKSEIIEKAKNNTQIKEDSFFIHIRKKDFRKSKAYHYNLPSSYYQNALNTYDRNRPCLIFSDDIDWCKKQELFSGNRFYFSDNYDRIPLISLKNKISYKIPHPAYDLF